MATQSRQFICHSEEEIVKQEQHYPDTYHVTFYSPAEEVDHLHGEYTLPEARDLCMGSQCLKCKLYDDQGFYKGYVDFDGHFFLN
jgi:hypothetical protein